MAPPPPKRPPTHRDYGIKRTPAKGVSVIKDDEWVDDTNTTSRQLDENTPVGLKAEEVAAEERLRARVKKTNETVTELKTVADGTKTVAESTATGVDTLRLEVEQHVERLDRSIVGVHEEFGEFRAEIRQHVSGLGDEVRTLSGHVLDGMKTVNSAVVAMSEFQGNIVKSHTEIDTVSKISKIEDRKDAKIKRRSLWYSILKWVGRIGAAGGVVLVTHLAEHC